MTLTEFFHQVQMTFPKAEYQLRIDAESRRTPAYTEKSFGRETSHREALTSKASYHLTFTPNFFLTSHTDESFEAPSLQALWETLRATYLQEGKDTMEELESWLKERDTPQQLA